MARPRSRADGLRTKEDAAMHGPWGWSAALILVGVLGGCAEESGHQFPGGDGELVRDEDGSISAEAEVAFDALEIGDCFNDDETWSTSAEAVELFAVAAVPCSQPHDNETFHVFQLPKGEYPGDEALAAQTFDACLDPFADYVGVSYEQSELEVFSIWPTAESWGWGNRGTVCAAYLYEEQLTGSVQGSRR
jgi:hypothetical protein